MAGPGSRDPARSGRSALRPRSCCSTPGSAVPSPTRRASSTKPRLRPIGTPSFRPSRTWKTISPACASSTRKPPSNSSAVAAAQRSFDLSNQRYKGGVTSYLEVLTAETTLLSQSAHPHRPPDPPVRRQRAADPRPGRWLGRDRTAQVAFTGEGFRVCRSSNSKGERSAEARS